MSFGARSRAVLASLGAAGLALAAAVSPASAADATPVTPTQLFNGYQSCSTDADRPTYLWAGNGLTVEGIPGTTDTTSTSLVNVQYQVWPVTDPTHTTTVTRANALPGFEATANLPADALPDGQTYAWRAQTVAGDAASEWSDPCYIAIDNTPPANAPDVSSSNYPEGRGDQGGSPVEFTLNADGDDDVTGFEYSWQQDLPIAGSATIGDHGVPQFVDPYADPRYFTRADAPGGSATISLLPPSGSSGLTRLWVRSLDRAYNGSAVTSYSFFLDSTAPTVTPAVASPEFDTPTTFTLRPGAGLQSTSPVVSYSVETVGGQGGDKTVDVQAGPDGTASVELALDGIYGESLRVSSTSADGWVSDTAFWGISYDTTPTIASDVYPENGSGGGAGVPGTFTFTPKVEDVASYTYSVNGDPEVTVTADAHHTASVDWTPTASGDYDLTVHATTRSGIALAPYDYYFTVS
ncbi:hypothetical protein [Streptomyces xylophagus]|uniref:hypothetical protein n=1 Tax=Streptomyces xylophagus TaxID=285514 RepID=UPI0005BDE86A|nr:hypothetical protein [Streptomyces xylophagus]